MSIRGNASLKQKYEIEDRYFLSLNFLFKFSESHLSSSFILQVDFKGEVLKEITRLSEARS
jgi:hypothetical protein